MKLDPRSTSGIICIVLIFVALSIKKFLDLSEDFYYATLGIIIIINATIYSIIKEYNEKHFDKVKKPRNSKIIFFDGVNLKNDKDLFTEFAKKLEFPDYFGYNWNALDECLTDLEWLKFTSLTIIIKHYDTVLIDSNKESKTIFEELLNDAIEFWNNDYEVSKPWGHKARCFEVIYEK